MLYREIQDELQLTDSKLRKLQQRIFRKLHAENRSEAVKFWRGILGRAALIWSAAGPA